MGIADELLDLMFRWMEKRKDCAEQLRKLARELEDLKEKCNGSQCVGNTLSVVGAASLLGAGVATLFTGGLAAPFLGLLGAAYTGVGLTISLVTHLTEHLSSSETMKKAQSIESESNEIAERIKRLFEQLRKECKAESFNADEDELDQRVMAKIPAAIARRNGQKWTVCDSIKWSSSSGPQSSLEAPLSNPLIMSAIATGVAGILVVFAFKASGKKSKLLFAEAGKQIIKKMSATGLKTVLKGAGMVAGGAVGLAFALPEAIDSWKKMIENNHVTEASQSLRDTADALDQVIRTLRNQLEVMMRVMAQRQEEYEAILEEESMEEERMKKERMKKERMKKERMKKERLEKERLEKERTPNILRLFLFQSYILEEKKEKKEKKKNPFVRAALLNVQSMNNKTSKILELITENQLDIFFSTETWLESDTADDVLREASPKHFSFFRHVSEVERRRGVAIQFSPVLHGRQIHSDNMETFECVVTVLKRKEWEEPVLSINLYRPPEKTPIIITNFLDEFQELLDLVSQNYNNIIVTGDFNIWVDCDWRADADEFYWFLVKNGFNLCPWEPTYRRSDHTLDLVLTRNVELSDVKVRDDHISDHYTVYFNWRPRPKG